MDDVRAADRPDKYITTIYHNDNILLYRRLGDNARGPSAVDIRTDVVSEIYDEVIVTGTTGPAAKCTDYATVLNTALTLILRNHTDLLLSCRFVCGLTRD